jgi:colanic acid biosynthesis glycosyl transferase WcaI
MKNILLISNNYTPEKTGIAYYNTEMMEFIISLGFKTTVLTTFPYYPEWKLNPNYKQKLFFCEEINDVVIHRCPIYIPGKLTSLKRIVHELSFLCTAFFTMFRILRNRYDYIFYVTPSIFLFPIAKFISLFNKNCKLITHVQDLQPDTAINLGMIKNPIVIKALYIYERFIYRNSHYVSTISTSMMNVLKSKNIKNQKFLLFPNWTNTDEIVPLNQKETYYFKKYFNENDFIIGYSGNFGEKQGLEILLDLAEEFKDSRIKFLLTGAGAVMESFIKGVNSKQLKNVVLLPTQEKSRLNELISTSSIHILPQKEKMGDNVLPSKFLNIMSAGRPVLVACEKGTTLQTIVVENSVGRVCTPENIKSYIKEINDLSANDELLNSYAKNARDYAVREIDLKSIIPTFIQSLK